ncbi:hypothetical protein AVEN_155978-1 [Araneus ventricosus]|uniref:Uncharacterized protein n=1 Tax=Araneus ventricosus TaxID=182803 RepID=A0A4Y2D6W4_ARAVE|nr:hypothetical protein AVEN_155978-1 [Araneus ventricosus]
MCRICNSSSNRAHDCVKHIGSSDCMEIVGVYTMLERSEKMRNLQYVLDKSPNRSRVPSSQVLIGNGQLLTGVLCRRQAGSILPTETLPVPLWACVWPNRFMTLTFDLASLRGLLCGPQCREKDVG